MDTCLCCVRCGAHLLERQFRSHLCSGDRLKKHVVASFFARKWAAQRLEEVKA